MEIEEEELKEYESKNVEEEERQKEEKTDVAKEEIDKSDQPVETKIKEEKVEPEKKKKITTPIKFESSSSKLEKKSAIKNETTVKSEPLVKMIEIDPSKPVGKFYNFRRNKIRLCNLPRWLSGLERVSNSSKHSLEDPGSNPARDVFIRTNLLLSYHITSSCLVDHSNVNTFLIYMLTLESWCKLMLSHDDSL